MYVMGFIACCIIYDVDHRRLNACNYLKTTPDLWFLS